MLQILAVHGFKQVHNVHKVSSPSPFLLLLLSRPVNSYPLFPSLVAEKGKRKIGVLLFSSLVFLMEK